MEVKGKKHSFLIYTSPDGQVRVESFKDVEQVKNWLNYGKEYFEEMAEIIREIRTSEKGVYRKIKDLFAKCSIDYEPGAPGTNEFFSLIQNKLHWAILGQKASEIIARRADAGKPYMGLTHWKNAPHGPIRKADINVAKNYLKIREVRALKRLVNRFLEYAIKQIGWRVPMAMQDWKDELDHFLHLNDYPVLPESEEMKISDARLIAEMEFEKYRKEKDEFFTRPSEHKICLN